MTRPAPYDVIVAGELNVDLVVKGDVEPEFGQVEKLVDDMTLSAGGSACIFAASAAKMGLKVLYVSRVGDDLFGRYMLEAMHAVGVDVSRVKVDPAIKTGATIILSKGQDRAMLTYLGSIAKVCYEDLGEDWFHMARHLHVASPFLLTALRPNMPKMMRLAREAGMTVSLDTNWDPTEEWKVDDLLEHVDVFLPNENEIMAITGERDIERAIQAMAARVPTLVVKLGAEGAVAIRKGERIRVPAWPVQVMDTTGAGDTFDGGFLAGWLKGEPLERAVKLAVTCGALTVAQVGGFNGQPTWEEAVAYLAAHGQW
ncbi:MAG: sugar kinase [Chloroflexi bacterium]|nr:sugar kinase [Chloroflexota bacterium]